MEVANKQPPVEKLKNIFLKEPVPFATRREPNWKAIKWAGVTVVGATVVFLLLYSPAPTEETSYHEKAEPGSTQVKSTESAPSDTALSQIEQGRVNMNSVPRSLDYLYSRSGGSGGGSLQGGNSNRNSSMIVSRGGLDSKTQLPPGSRIRIKIIEQAIIANQSMPVIGLVASDYIHEDGLAIPKDSKIFGEISFDESSERAQFSWRSIQFPDGRERPISAIGVGFDGQIGVEGKVHSNAFKNTVGQTLTRFIGAYAEGSMQRGAFGGNPGGSDNGWKNAIGETAKDRADAWADDLKKEKKWIELRAGTESFAVLNQPFTFRDPGGSLR